MSDKNSNQRIEDLIEKKREIERQIKERVGNSDNVDHGELIQESYQPTINELDDENPPDD